MEASVNPKRELTFKYTPMETGTEYLAPVTENGVSKVSGDERTVMLEFTQANPSPNSTDPWLATIRLATQEDVEPGGIISVMLVVDTGYTVGTVNTATVAVNDISIPELSIADAEDIVAGKNAEYMVTSSIPFIGDLSVAYTLC